MVVCDGVPCCRFAATAQEAEAVHALPDDGPRKRVRWQLVHHAPEALGDRLPAAPQRAPGQGLVPEQADETQETQRARQANDIPRRRRACALAAVHVIGAAPHVATNQRRPSP